MSETETLTRDSLGDRMKVYERIETARTLNISCPVVVRIDGRSFSRFTRGFKRPFDDRMSFAMIGTTAALVEKTHAVVGYTQSDEITLVFVAEPGSDMLFSGKVQKLTSVLAGLATAAFMREVINRFPGDVLERLPHFDARAFNVPDLSEAANCLLWRIRDAEKNSVTMACAEHFSHRQMHQKNGQEKRNMLASVGVDFDELPSFFRVGTILNRAVVSRPLSGGEREAIPEKHRPQPGAMVQRTEIHTVDMPKTVNHDWLKSTLVRHEENPK